MKLNIIRNWLLSRDTLFFALAIALGAYAVPWRAEHDRVNRIVTIGLLFLYALCEILTNFSTLGGLATGAFVVGAVALSATIGRLLKMFWIHTRKDPNRLR